MSHVRMASIETVSSVSRPSSIKSRPIERYGCPLVAAGPTRTSRPSG